MAKLEPEMSSRGSEAMTLGRFAAACLVSLMIVGMVTACARRPASSEGRDDDKLLATALRKWEANVQAKRAATTEPQWDEGGASPATRSNLSEALMEAAQAGDAKLVESLLARGADRKILNEALLVAARSEPLVIGGASGQEDIELLYAATARVLLEKGASIEARDEYGRTPLISAAGDGDTAVVKLLLEKSADIEATDTGGRTALIAAACNCPIVDMPDTDDSVRLLLDKGANIEAKDDQGGTALIAAAAWGRASILQILLAKGAQIEARDNHGNTALLISAAGGGYPTAEAVQMLLARGADIEARNNDGDTALMLAASNGGSEDVKIVKMLLNRGADVRTKDKRGRTALDVATGKDRTEIVSLLRAAMEKSP